MNETTIKRDSDDGAFIEELNKAINDAVSDQAIPDSQAISGCVVYDLFFDGEAFSANPLAKTKLPIQAINGLNTFYRTHKEVLSLNPTINSFKRILSGLEEGTELHTFKISDIQAGGSPVVFSFSVQKKASAAVLAESASAASAASATSAALAAPPVLSTFLRFDSTTPTAKVRQNDGSISPLVGDEYPTLKINIFYNTDSKKLYVRRASDDDQINFASWSEKMKDLFISRELSDRTDWTENWKQMLSGDFFNMKLDEGKSVNISTQKVRDLEVIFGDKSDPEKLRGLIELDPDMIFEVSDEADQAFKKEVQKRKLTFEQAIQAFQARAVGVFSSVGANEGRRVLGPAQGQAGSAAAAAPKPLKATKRKKASQQSGGAKRKSRKEKSRQDLSPGAAKRKRATPLLVKFFFDKQTKYYYFKPAIKDGAKKDFDAWFQAIFALYRGREFQAWKDHYETLINDGSATIATTQGDFEVTRMDVSRQGFGPINHCVHVGQDLLDDPEKFDRQSSASEDESALEEGSSSDDDPSYSSNKDARKTNPKRERAQPSRGIKGPETLGDLAYVFSKLPTGRKVELTGDLNVNGAVAGSYLTAADDIRSGEMKEDTVYVHAGLPTHHAVGGFCFLPTALVALDKMIDAAESGKTLSWLDTDINYGDALAYLTANDAMKKKIKDKNLTLKIIQVHDGGVWPFPNKRSNCAHRTAVLNQCFEGTEISYHEYDYAAEPNVSQGGGGAGAQGVSDSGDDPMLSWLSDRLDDVDHIVWSHGYDNHNAEKAFPSPHRNRWLTDEGTKSLAEMVFDRPGMTSLFIEGGYQKEALKRLFEGTLACLKDKKAGLIISDESMGLNDVSAAGEGELDTQSGRISLMKAVAESFMLGSENDQIKIRMLSGETDCRVDPFYNEVDFQKAMDVLKQLLPDQDEKFKHIRKMHDTHQTDLGKRQAKAAQSAAFEATSAAESGAASSSTAGPGPASKKAKTQEEVAAVAVAPSAAPMQVDSLAAELSLPGPQAEAEELPVLAMQVNQAVQTQDLSLSGAFKAAAAPPSEMSMLPQPAAFDPALAASALGDPSGTQKHVSTNENFPAPPEQAMTLQNVFLPRLSLDALALGLKPWHGESCEVFSVLAPAGHGSDAPCGSGDSDDDTMEETEAGCASALPRPLDAALEAAGLLGTRGNIDFTVLGLPKPDGNVADGSKITSGFKAFCS